jgi:hypothetical protein
VDGQSGFTVSSGGQATLTGPDPCSGRTSPFDTVAGERMYEFFHDCDAYGYAMIVLAADGRSLRIHWDEDSSDGYVRA